MEDATSFDASISPLAEHSIRGMSTGTGFYYISSFLSTELEQQILQGIYEFPSSKWTNLSRRRLLSLPSLLTGSKRDTLLDAPMPRILVHGIADQFEQLGVFKDSPHREPNHCLVNEYLPGQGIMPHEDGPAYHPVTATVSLGSYTVLNIYEKNEDGERNVQPTWRILQEPRSLLVTTSSMYSDTLHGIEEVKADENLDEEHIVNWDMLNDRTPYKSGTAQRGNRVSLTYRDVLKVVKVGGLNKFINKR